MPSWKNEIRILINSLNSLKHYVGGLYLNGEFYSYQDIANGRYSVKDEYYQQTLDFCREYLTGAQEFPILTSGSTGLPRTIRLTRQQIKSSAHQTIKALGLQQQYNGLVCISITHIGGKMMLVRGMELGMAMYLTEPKAELDTGNLPPIDFVALVPLQLQHLINTVPGQNFLKTCKATIIGGSPIQPQLESQLDQFSHPIYHTFGMTETASHFALRRLNGPEKQENYVAFEGVQLSLDDRGCLVVKGDITNNTALITNDLIKFIDKNTFMWLGRYDQIINTGGHKVHPETLKPAIQKILTSGNINANFLIMGLPHSKWGQQVTLVLEMDPLSEEAEMQLFDQFKKELHPYEIPKAFSYLREFPKTDSGKVDVPQIARRFNIQGSSV